MATIARATWNVTESGDYAVDCRSGRVLADQIVREMKQTSFPGALGHVMQEIVSRGHVGGTEIGFFQRLAEHLIR